MSPSRFSSLVEEVPAGGPVASPPRESRFAGLRQAATAQLQTDPVQDADEVLRLSDDLNLPRFDIEHYLPEIRAEEKFLLSSAGPEEVTLTGPKKANPITLREQIGRMDALDWAKRVPFSPAAAFETAELLAATRRLSKGGYEEQAAAQLQQAESTAGRMAATGKPRVLPGPQDLQGRDAALIEGWLLQQQERAERGQTFAAAVFDGVSYLPSWMIEFALTGGLAKLGSETAKEIGLKTLQGYAKTTAGRAVLKTAGWTGGALTRTTLGMPQRIGEEILARRIPSITVGPDGELSIGVAPESWATSIAKGWGAAVIESASETSGGAVAGGAKWLTEKTLAKLPLGRELYSGLRRAYLAIHAEPGAAAEFTKRFFSRTAYDGLIGELGEERVNSVLHRIAATRRFSDKADASYLENLTAGITHDIDLAKTGRQLLVEATVLSLPGAVGLSAQMAAKISAGGPADSQTGPVLSGQGPSESGTAGQGTAQVGGPGAPTGKESLPVAPAAPPAEGPSMWDQAIAEAEAEAQVQGQAREVSQSSPAPAAPEREAGGEEIGIGAAQPGAGPPAGGLTEPAAGATIPAMAQTEGAGGTPESPSPKPPGETKRTLYYTGQQADTAEDLREKHQLYTTQDPDFAAVYNLDRDKIYSVAAKPDAKLLDAANRDELRRVAQQMLDDRDAGTLSRELDEMTEGKSVAEVADLIGGPTGLKADMTAYDSYNIAEWLWDSFGYDGVTFPTDQTMLAINQDAFDIEKTRFDDEHNPLPPSFNPPPRSESAGTPSSEAPAAPERDKGLGDAAERAAEAEAQLQAAERFIAPTEFTFEDYAAALAGAKEEDLRRLGRNLGLKLEGATGENLRKWIGDAIATLTKEPDPEAGAEKEPGTSGAVRTAGPVSQFAGASVTEQVLPSQEQAQARGPASPEAPSSENQPTGEAGASQEEFPNIRFVGRAKGRGPRYSNSAEWRDAQTLAERMQGVAVLEIYDQAQTGSLYANLVKPDGSLIPVRIADHPSKFSVARFAKKAQRPESWIPMPEGGWKDRTEPLPSLEAPAAPEREVHPGSLPFKKFFERYGQALGNPNAPENKAWLERYAAGESTGGPKGLYKDLVAEWHRINAWRAFYELTGQERPEPLSESQIADLSEEAAPFSVLSEDETREQLAQEETAEVQEAVREFFGEAAPPDLPPAPPAAPGSEPAPERDPAPAELSLARHILRWLGVKDPDGGFEWKSNRDVGKLWSALQLPHDRAIQHPEYRKFREVQVRRQRNFRVLVQTLVDKMRPYWDLSHAERAGVNELLAAIDQDPGNGRLHANLQAALSEPQRAGAEAVRRTLDDCAEMLITFMQQMGVRQEWIDQFRGRIGNYIPHAWYGDWVLIVRDKLGTRYKAQGSKWQMAAEFTRLQHEFPGAQILGPFENTKIPAEAYQESPYAAQLSMLEIILEKAKTGMANDPALSPEQKEAVLGAAAEWWKEMGFGAHFIQRQEVPGWTADLERPLAEYLQGFAGSLTKMQAGLEFAEALREIDPRRTPELYARALQDMRYWMGEDTDWQRYMGFQYAWNLTASIASAVVNTTQNATLGWPVLSKYTGWSLAKLTTAMADVAGDTLDGRETAYLAKKEKEGFLEARATQEIAARWGNPALRALSSRIDQALSFLEFMQTAERFNRKSMYVALLRAGVAQETALPGQDPADALVNEAHFEYGKGNRQPIFRGLLKPLSLFQTWTMNYYTWLKNEIKAGDVGPLARHFAALTAVAGFGGLPLIGQLLRWAYPRVFGSDPEEDAKDLIGKLPAQVLFRGLPSLVGVSLTGSAGASEIIPLPEPGQDWSEAFTRWAGGVTADLPSRVARIGQDLAHRNYARALEDAGPRPVRNILEARRLYSEGATTRGGRPILDIGAGQQMKLTEWEALLKGMGFQLDKLTRERQLGTVLKIVQNGFANRKAHWADRLYLAIKSNNDEEVRAVEAEIAAFTQAGVMETAAQKRALRRDILTMVKTRAKPVNLPSRDMLPLLFEIWGKNPAGAGKK